jgi:hypothetical protein
MGNVVSLEHSCSRFDWSDLQLSQHGGEGAAAMAVGELGRKVNFGHSALQFREKEKRVVPEASGAARCIKNYALDGAVGSVLDSAVAGGDQHAVIAGFPLFGWNIADSLKEDDVIPDIGIVVGVRGIHHSRIGGETSRADAGSAVDGIDFKAGVIGEHKFAGCELGVIDGLNGGIRGEGIAVLIWWFDVGKTGKSIDADCVSFSGGAKIAQLSLAGGGNVETKAHDTSLTGGEVARNAGGEGGRADVRQI